MKLSIKIDSEGEPPSPLPAFTLEKLEGVLGEALPLLCQTGNEIEKYPEAEISLTFLGQAEMRDVNKQYRGVDEPTDVLSFPMLEDFTASNDAMPDVMPPSALEILPLGDIVICLEETEREYSQMPRQEALCLVLAHGFLHLLGWDHDTPEKEESMWERQELLKTKLMQAAPPIGAALTGEVL